MGLKRTAIDGARILVTGASSGIGASFCRQLAPRCRGLIIVARRRDRLEALADELGSQCEVDVRACDLADSDQLDDLRATVDLDELDGLINNAAFPMFGDFAQHDEARVLEMLNVNIAAVVKLTRWALPEMLARGHGWIYNVGSIAGLQGSPYMAAYAATKSFINDFSEAIAEECRRARRAGTAGVFVGALLPGSTRTEFFDVGHAGMSQVPKIFQSADAVARVGIRAIERRRVLTVSGWPNRISSAFSRRALPRSWVVRVAGHLLGRLSTGS